MPDLVALEVSAGIGTLQLRNRPKNILCRQALEELHAAACAVSLRDDVRAVIVYGGEVRYGRERVFSIGADVAELVDATYPAMAADAPAFSAALTAVARIPKPTVAAITGYALGGGLELALCCDRRIAGAGGMVGLPEILLGIIPGAGGTQRLARLAGPAVAKDLIYTGRLVDACEARELGIVDEVVPMDEVYRRAAEWAGGFAGGPAVALRAAKEAIDGGLRSDLASGLELESHLFAALFATEDQKTGMRSYLEHGPGRAGFAGR
jgi:enoyl-CoA hydratase/carnithine racemase